jgi:DNA-binding CsgD family transcriptional regulator
VLLGRTTECGRIDGLLERVRGGESGVLVLRGDPGIGKTALLRYARERAQGLTVVETRGVESEAEFPFSALAELLGPLLGGIDRLPAPQAAALKSALALGPPVPGDAFAVATGALRLIQDAARDSPLLVLVDDAHWLDAGSAETLLFALRRLDADGVAVLIAVRDHETNVFDEARISELRLEGLDRSAAGELLAATPASRLAAAVTDSLVVATAGNPLALLELPALLSEAQLDGQAPLPDPLPVAPSVRRAFEVKLSALPPDTQRALLVAASSQSDVLKPVLDALAVLGLDASTLEPAERAALVSLGAERLAWRHPLLRSASYYRASTFERRAVHAALASVSTGVERAWHLADAALGPDETVAHALEEAAMNARLRRGHVAAAIAFERAARLSNDSDDAARRDLEAARDYHLAGRVEQARRLLRAALSSTLIPVVQADIEHLLGVIEMWSGDAAVAHELLRAAATRVEAVDPGRAAAILMNAAIAREMAGDVNGTLATVRRAHDLAQGGLDTEPQLLRAMTLAGQGRVARPALLKLVAAEPAVPRPPTPDSVHLVATIGQALIWLGEYAEARRLFERELLAARTSGSLSPMPYLLACLSELEFRAGRFQAAYANSVESVRVAEETGQRSVLSFCLATLARVEAATAREEDCRDHVRRALELAGELGARSIRIYALAALGLLELGLGRASAALVVLEELVELVEELGPREPGVIEWVPDLIEAQLLCGRVEEARKSLRSFEEQARSTENSWASAAAARMRGMLAETGFEPEFDAALRGQASPFERARTQLRLGARLRRERRPTDARSPLRSAHDSFQLLGAHGWAAQASAELGAAGGRPKRPHASSSTLLHDLTEQELRIALLVAKGVTNREAAATLFLSPKTVGYHLGKVYGKLGVRSRTELAHLIARA